MELKLLLGALHKIVTTLNENKIEYQLSGSLAGKFYGLTRESSDIDFALPIKYRPDIERLFGDSIVKAFYRCKDDFFDLDQIKCVIDDIQVEFGFNENGFYHSHITGKAIALGDFWRPFSIKFRNTTVQIQSIEKLTEYKSHNRNPEFASNQIEDSLELEKIMASGSWKTFQIEAACEK